MSDFSSVPASLRLGWRLPFDVVSAVMTVSQRSTISALMKTCRTVYTEGPRHLLRNGVELASADEIDKFTAFMLAEDPSRFAYLRKLVLLADPDGHHLVRLLSHPSIALETLVLRPPETVLRRFRNFALCEAIGRLTTVKHLVLTGVDEYTIDRIRKIPWALQSISIHVKSRAGDALPKLTPFSGTLRTLLIDPEPRIPNRFSDGRLDMPFHFPHVQTFGIVCSESSSDLLATPAFAEAFPAITHLQLIPADAPTTRRRARRPAGRNLFSVIDSTSRYPSDCTRPLWPSLTECSGGLRNVHALRLPCTLSTLRLWQDVEADELDVLRAVLERTRPNRLCLSTGLDDAEALFAAFPGLQAPPERIDMKIFVSREATVALLSVLEALLQEVPTVLVELNLLFDIPSSVDRPAERSAVRDTLAAFTHQASTAAPSLRLTCKLSEEGDDRHWQWPDLRPRVRQRAVYREAPFDLDPEDDGYPFGDGEDDFILGARERYESLKFWPT